MSARPLRVTLACAALALASLAPAPAHADPSSCTLPAPCATGFHCHAGDIVSIVVTGPGQRTSPDRVQGVVRCGSVSINCTSNLGSCADSAVTTQDDDNGLCDLTEGTSATCSAAPADDAGAGNGLICPLLALLYPPEGDVYVGVVKVWDCPPYDA